MFTIFVAISILSPFLRNLGMFGWTMISFWVTSSFFEYPNARALVWASSWSFHLVSASGTVAANSMVPLESVLKLGKKKAVSLKFLRGTMSSLLLEVSVTTSLGVIVAFPLIL